MNCSPTVLVHLRYWYILHLHLETPGKKGKLKPAEQQRSSGDNPHDLIMIFNLSLSTLLRLLLLTLPTTTTAPLPPPMIQFIAPLDTIIHNS